MYVAGIDAHTTYLVVAVVSNTGERVLAPTKVQYDRRERLLQLLAQYRPLEVVIEASPSWPWLHDMLAPQGVHFVLAHSKRLRIIAEGNYKKDEIDAELLARMRLAGCIPAIHAKDPAQRDVALLVRHRVWLVKQRTSLVNRMHAQLHAVGLRMPRGRLLTMKGRAWLHEEAWPALTREQHRLIRTHEPLIHQLTLFIRGLDRRIDRTAQSFPVCRFLCTIPGIGSYRALMIASEVLPIERFPTSSRLVSYAGLAPRTMSSGLRSVRHASLPAGANRWLRGTFVRAVVSHVQYAPNSWLTAYYAQMKDRLGWRVARIATARKLARAVHHMLRTGECWNSEVDGRSGLHFTHAASTARNAD